MNFDIDNLVQSVLADLNVENLPEKRETHFPVRDAVAPKVAVPEFFFGSRVVSLEQIKTLPENAAKIFIAPKSILTPSAKDEVRKRNIEIATKIEKQDNRRQSKQLSFGFVQILPFKLFYAVQKEFLVKPQAFADRNALLDGAEKQTAAGQQAVIFSEQPAAALCFASVRQALRPIPAFDTTQVQEDAKEINANVLVVNPKRFNETALIEVIRAFENK
ncbi:MAG: hypothetical protein LBN39_09450 [Planctomycetaceae bacterium]|jgi:hypothetical protein|nr:hypothetical protein [Planctomycetaceae bacterium]